MSTQCIVLIGPYDSQSIAQINEAAKICGFTVASSVTIEGSDSRPLPVLTGSDRRNRMEIGKILGSFGHKPYIQAALSDIGARRLDDLQYVSVRAFWQIVQTHLPKVLTEMRRSGKRFQDWDLRDEVHLGPLAVPDFVQEPLCHVGIEELGVLLRLQWKDVKDIHGVGEKCLNKLREILADNGLRLDD